MDSSLLLARAYHLLPELQTLSTQIEADPMEVIQQLRTLQTSVDDEPVLGLESLPSFAPGEQSDVFTDMQYMRQLLADAQSAIQKLAQGQASSNLTEDEMDGLESVVNLERPMLRIIEGLFESPPDKWNILYSHRESIRAVCRSVGRVQIYGQPRLFPYVGTGFLVAEHIMMTNRHVAEQFCDFKCTPGTFIAGITPSIDYLGEVNNIEKAEFDICELIGTHPSSDLALFRVEHCLERAVSHPQPLILAENEEMLYYDSHVYVVGYPHWNGEGPSLRQMQRIYPGPNGVKRLQPGRIVQPQDGRHGLIDGKNDLLHDCSTLTGNSGSCLVALQTHRVVGLHYRGLSDQKPVNYNNGITDGHNRAIPLWTLRSDRLFRNKGIIFA